MVLRVSVRAAGSGAAEQARRHAARAEELRRELARVEREQRNWELGAQGERLVAETLTVLEAYGWTLLHDVRWPGRARANIDHVAIGPGGVVVLDSKNWSGEVSLRADGLRVGGRSMARELTGVGEATAAVAALVPARHRRHVLGVLCLVHQPVRAGEVGAVTVVGRDGVAGLLRALPAVLGPRDVERVAGDLAAALAVPAGDEEAVTGSVPVPRGPARQPARASRRQPARTRRTRPVRRRQRRAPGPLRAALAVLLVLTAVLVVHGCASALAQPGVLPAVVPGAATAACAVAGDVRAC
ncbi:nuclease-related domain-containing protein [Kineococcus gypseus]|uniref:nuclease-related domain-containing protein n=1 Tax=Kineococcus gypseus TaxID=1637102 RepID=UPI003D7CC849